MSRERVWDFLLTLLVLAFVATLLWIVLYPVLRPGPSVTRTVHVIRSEAHSRAATTDWWVLTTQGLISNPPPDDYARLSVPGPHCVTLGAEFRLRAYRHPGPCLPEETTRNAP